MMFKNTSFLSLLLSASLAFAVPTEVVKRTTSAKADYEGITAVAPRAADSALIVRSLGEVLSDYEDIPITGLPGLTSNVPLSFYNQLTYAGFRAVRKTGTGTLLQQIDGLQCAVGGNGSTITSVYLASPVASFQANYASFGCYLSTSSGASPGVACTVQVTAFKTDGSLYADKAGCAYGGLGMINQCTFPTTWTNVAKLSFEVVASEILQTVGPTLGSLLGGIIGTIGSIGFIIDDFDAIFHCVDGKSNSVVAPGLCG
ncbi:2afc6540-72e2-46b6-ba30-f1afcc61057b [Sclerotinia trifoliorum]|uniref:2afc6540-72e2-46b6-ba30-f1afcc61057b n=1 Tax=Sclerotinia trifoliorum TaxID=28548 RepID=A0A8H2VZD8_9HELO|nr:2afc6540-72e2-46b6-ba30-f1afcc61057b [Sclerotinia trifoliorum]